MTYRITTKVTGVFERKLQKHISGYGKDAIFQTNSAGWYIQLGGEISIYVGREKPAEIVGDEVLIRIGRVK